MKHEQTPSSTRSPSCCGGKCASGSRSHSRICSRLSLASALNKSGSSMPEVWHVAKRLANRAGPRRLPPAELTLGHDHRGAAHLNAVNAGRRTVHPRMQDRGPADFSTLPDLDLLAEPDPAVAGQVNGQRA